MVLGANGLPVSKTSTGSEIDSDIQDTQEAALKGWAVLNNVWYEDPQSYYKCKGFRYYGFGGEAQVYSEDDAYVHKICRTGQYDDLSHFFDRIVIQNTLCPAASLFVEGFGRDGQGDFVVLMKQRFFRQSHIMTESEINLYMKCLGFKCVLDERYNNWSYYSDTVIAEDLHPGNIWMTEESNVVIIDGRFAFNM